MTTRFLGRVPIRQRKPSGPAAAAAERENKENRLEDDKADVVGEDTLLAMLNESKIPDRAVRVELDLECKKLQMGIFFQNSRPKPLMESPRSHCPGPTTPIKSVSSTAAADLSSEAIITSPTAGKSKEKRKRVSVNHSVSHSNGRNCSLTPAERLQE